MEGDSLVTGRRPCLIAVAMAVTALCVPVDAQRETAADVRLQAEAGDAERHVLAIILAISVPPAVLPWFVVHGFIAFWRRLGATATYVIMVSGYVAIAAGLFTIRIPILGADLGTNWWTVGVGSILYCYSAWVGVRMRKYLSLRTLAGVPEVANEHQQLLTEGFYENIRHPRYLSALVGITGLALIVNYLGIYLMTALLYPVMYAVILLEEYELVTRFGEQYRKYQRQVPRMVPRHR